MATTLAQLEAELEYAHEYLYNLETLHRLACDEEEQKLSVEHIWETTQEIVFIEKQILRHEQDARKQEENARYSRRRSNKY